MKFNLWSSKTIVLLLAFGAFNVISQKPLPCGSASIMESAGVTAYYINANKQIANTVLNKTDRSTLIVPVVFHIVYNTPDQNIPDSLIFQQIDRLNEDFTRTNADTINTPDAFKVIAGAMDIEFCLARISPSGESSTGILRIPTDELSFSTVASYDLPDPVKHSSTAGSDAWNTEEYLNIWICNLSGSTAYTAPPGNFVDPADDGIVCHYNHIGNSGIIPYDLGRSIVHEAGHWFGLKHIWGDDGGSCVGTDYMADTPNQANWTGGCPDFPLNDACSPAGSGVMFMNYMDYSHDGCRNMFSLNQVTYMESFYEALMSDYYTVDHCTIDDLGIDNLADKPTITVINNTVFITSNDIISKVICYQINGQFVQNYAIHSNEAALIVPIRGLLIFEIHFVENHKPQHIKFVIP